MENCLDSYVYDGDKCVHTLWPFTLMNFIGTIFLMIATVLSSLSGLGGGGVIIPSLIMFYDYLPKDATIVVYCCILGTSLGNVSNLLQDSIDGKPLINYEMMFISIPFVFTGAILGVVLNKFLPSIAICLIIIYLFFKTIMKTVKRFKDQYSKQTYQINNNIEYGANQNHSRINPFENQRAVYVFKNFCLLMVITIIFTFSKGSEKVPSLIGVQPCSVIFWIISITSFILMSCFGLRHLNIARQWFTQNQLLQDEIKEFQNPIDTHKKQIIIGSLGGGILSGFGLGGGIILVPMYRSIGCDALSSAGSVVFGIFLTAFINSIQGIAIGVIQINELIFFTGTFAISTYMLSKTISKYLKKKNRMSYITGFFIFFISFGTINIPISVYQKYQESGYNADILFGFGSPC